MPISSYKEAIQEVINAIEKGATPYLLGKPTKDLLLRNYDKDFRRQLPPGREQAWEIDKNRVLVLATRVGQLAAALSLAASASSNKPPKKLRKAHVDLAAYVGSKLFCPPIKRGRYCMNYTVDGSLDDAARELTTAFSPRRAGGIER